jgi:hypothetical protein
VRYLVLCCIACDPANAKPSQTAADQTSSAGVLDFDLVHRSTGGFVIKDPAYELTMPAKPSFKQSASSTPTGSRVTAMTAAATLDAGDTIVLSVAVLPDDLKLDATGLGEMAADHLRLAGAKPTSDTKATLGGLPARKVVGTGTNAGKSFQIIEYLALDSKHHAVVGITDLSQRVADPAFETVRSSFVVKAGPAPHARTAK